MTSHSILLSHLSPFSVMYMRTCKELIRNTVSCVHGREISILYKKPTWRNQVSLISYLDYGEEILISMTFKISVYWRNQTVTWLIKYASTHSDSKTRKKKKYL